MHPNTTKHEMVQRYTNKISRKFKLTYKIQKEQNYLKLLYTNSSLCTIRDFSNIFFINKKINQNIKF